jgi:hypothetical protein
MGLDRDRLKYGLEDSLKDYIFGGFDRFYYRVLARSNTTVTLDVTLKSSSELANSRVIVKWYYAEPTASGFCHLKNNRIDVLFNSENRGVLNIGEIVVKGATDFRVIPTVLGTSINPRTIVMKRAGRKTQKNTYLQEAKRSKYDGEGELPKNLYEIFHNAIWLLTPLIGLSNSRVASFLNRHDYLETAKERAASWACYSSERLSLLQEDKSISSADLKNRLQNLSRVANSFMQPQFLSHGEFNLSQIVGDTLLDFELFGLYGAGKDLGTLGVVVGKGIKNSAGLFGSKWFGHITNFYFSSLKVAEGEGNYRSARRAVTKLKRRSTNFLRDEAIKRWGDKAHADMTLGVFYHALEELVRLGAAFDRMKRNEISKEQIKSYYNAHQTGVYRGIGYIFEVINQNARENNLFEKCSQPNERREFFKGYRSLLSDLGVIQQ